MLILALNCQIFYCPVGNRLTMWFNDSEEHIYSYDQTYQVTDVNYPDGYLAGDTTFNYDDASNRSSVIDNGITNYVSNELNQYGSVGGDAVLSSSILT